MNVLLPFVSNGIGIIILLILRYVSSTRVSKRRYADFLFNVMLFGIMGACVLEAASYAIDGKVFFGSILLNYLANTYLFTVNLLLPLSLVFYVDLSFFDDPRRMQHTYRPQILVSLIMLAATVANLFVPLCFKISDHNVYARLPFSYAYYVVIFYHFVSALVVQLRYNRERGPRAFVSIELFLLPIVVGTSLQFAFYGLSLAWVASAIGLCGLFMMQQNELAYIDGLTGTYNRQYLYHMLTSWSRSHTPLVGAMCDVDRFKGINDTYGHSEGDHALTVVAGALTEAAGDQEWVFRFAGDEFVVVGIEEDTDAIDACLTRAATSLADTGNTGLKAPVSISWGTSDYTNDIDDFLRGMDERMYAMKSIHHHQRQAAQR